MSARATITVVSAVVDMDAPTEATITSDYIDVEIVAYIDTSSDNQWVYETIPLSEVKFLSLAKNLTDTTTLTDENDLSFNKNSSETLALVESFARVVSYNREFSDIFTLDDISNIDKDFFGNKGNVTFITDIIGLDYSKIEEETVTVSDVVEVLLTFLRNFTETTTLTDTSVYNLEKVLTDSISLDDASLINKDYVGYKGNAFGFTDLLATSTSKGLEETLVFSEDLGLQYSKLDSDTVSIVELLDIAIQSKRTLNGLPLNTLIPLN